MNRNINWDWLEEMGAEERQQCCKHVPISVPSQQPGRQKLKCKVYFILCFRVLLEMLKNLTKQENMSRKVCFACSSDANEIFQMSSITMENPPLWKRVRKPA